MGGGEESNGDGEVSYREKVEGRRQERRRGERREAEDRAERREELLGTRK